MLGAFMVFPVLSVFADSYNMSTPFLIGLTLGIYGLTNAIMQIPFGLLSDYFGRKNIILVGLTIFLLGSFICAITDNIYYLIIGRALQGAGAISGALMALLSDSTSENNRTISMAIVGVSIGTAFFSAFIIGPVLSKYFELSGLFIFIILLTVLSIFLMLSFKNTPAKNAQFNFSIMNLVFDKLLKTHSIVHIHPNNVSNSTKYIDLEIPEVLEFTFLNNHRIDESKYNYSLQNNGELNG